MELTDLIPETPKFFLSNKQKEYELRIPNLQDRVDMTRMFESAEGLQEIFNQRKWDQICKLVYRLLIQKKDFLAETETAPDDEGIERTVLVTGPIKLLRAIQTQEEAAKMLGALTAAFTAGEPLVRDYVKAEIKKNSPAQLTGEKSSTSSQASMGTPQNNSELLPTGS